MHVPIFDASQARVARRGRDAGINRNLFGPEDGTLRIRRHALTIDVVYGAFWYQDWLKQEHIFRFILRIPKDGDTRTDVTGVDDSYSYWD